MSERLLTWTRDSRSGRGVQWSNGLVTLFDHIGVVIEGMALDDRRHIEEQGYVLEFDDERPTMNKKPDCALEQLIKYAERGKQFRFHSAAWELKVDSDSIRRLATEENGFKRTSNGWYYHIPSESLATHEMGDRKHVEEAGYVLVWDDEQRKDGE